MIMRLRITVELLYSGSALVEGCADIGSKLMKGCLVGLPSNQITIAAKTEHRVPLFARVVCQEQRCFGSRSSFADEAKKLSFQ